MTSAPTGHKIYHLPETHLRLSGQGLGKTMKSVGALAHKHAINHHGKVGAAVLHAVGHVATLKVKDKRKAFASYLVSQLKKHHYPKHSEQEVHAIIDKMKHKLIHAKDVFGANYKQHGQKLIGSLTGSGIFGSIGKLAKKGYRAAKTARDKAFHKLKAFAQGKTKFKPSQLANYAAAAVGAAGTASAFIPGVDLISVPVASAAALGLKSASLALKTSGRGLRLAGQGCSGSRKGKGLTLAGGSLEARGGALPKLPQSIKNYAKKFPKVAKAIAAKAAKGKGSAATSGSGKGPPKEFKGSGAAGRFGAAMGIAGTSAAAGAYGMYRYMLSNPTVAARVAAKGFGSVFSNFLGEGCKGKGAGFGQKRPVFEESKTDILRKSCKRRGNHEGLCRTLNPKGSVSTAPNKKGGCKKSKGKGFKGGAFSPDIIANMTSGHSFSKISALGTFLGLSGVALKKAWDYYQKSKKKKGKGLTLAGAGQALPYGVSRTPSGKIKKDRYGVYYGYYNKTGGGLTKAAFVLKGKKVISKKRQAMGRKNMNFKRNSS